MSNRTTELREGLTKHGIEWRSGLEGVTFVGDWCFVKYNNGLLAATCEAALTPEQAIAATLGNRKSTADAIAELRKVVREAFSGESVSILVEGHAIMRAIDAVEAATLGSEQEAELVRAMEDVLRHSTDTVWVGEAETLVDRMVSLGIYKHDVYEGVRPWEVDE